MIPSLHIIVSTHIISLINSTLNCIFKNKILKKYVFNILYYKMYMHITICLTQCILFGLLDQTICQWLKQMREYEMVLIQLKLVQ